MRKLLVIVICVCINTAAHAQQKTVDSLRRMLDKGNDTLAMVVHKQLSTTFWQLNLDSALVHAKHYLHFSQMLKYPLHEADALGTIASHLVSMENMANALELLFKGLKIVETANEKKLLPKPYRTLMQVPDTVSTVAAFRTYVKANLNMQLSVIYWASGSNKDTVYIRKAIALAQQIGADRLLGVCYFSLGAYIITRPDTALSYLIRGLALSLKTADHSSVVHAYAYHAWAYHYKNDHQNELEYRKIALLYAQTHKLTQDICWAYQGLAEAYQEANQYDSSFHYSYKALAMAQQIPLLNMQMYASNLLFNLYKAQNNKDSVLKYLEMKSAAYENIFNLDKQRRFQNVDFIQQIEQSSREAEQLEYKNKVKIFTLLAGMFVVLLIAGLLWRNNRHRQKAYALLQNQKQETERAYEQLKATQAQLIQREKMASLGELTAGIAHEIQNPLNFINNFSEVNKELLQELQEEQQKQPANKEANNALLSDVEMNTEKIIWHGKRADAIVKGMLQHARTSSNEKVPTDINSLAEEYLKLSYQGMKAKDKNLNAILLTNFDASVCEVAVVPQDLGRVLLNLFNNAFYAANEKKKEVNGTFEPVVSVNTRKEGNYVLISINDNGTGIPQAAVDKVFQPFFTTKPPGEGTGLGLSLSYDIITIGHAGELRVKSIEGEGSEFIISLPAN